MRNAKWLVTCFRGNKKLSSFSGPCARSIVYPRIACFTSGSSQQLIFALFVICILVARVSQQVLHCVQSTALQRICKWVYMHVHARAPFNDVSILYESFNIRSGGGTTSIGHTSIDPYSTSSLWKIVFVTQSGESNGLLSCYGFQ